MDATRVGEPGGTHAAGTTAVSEHLLTERAAYYRLFRRFAWAMVAFGTLPYVIPITGSWQWPAAMSDGNALTALGVLATVAIALQVAFRSGPRDVRNASGAHWAPHDMLTVLAFLSGAVSFHVALNGVVGVADPLPNTTPTMFLVRLGIGVCISALACDAMAAAAQVAGLDEAMTRGAKQVTTARLRVLRDVARGGEGAVDVSQDVAVRAMWGQAARALGRVVALSAALAVPVWVAVRLLVGTWTFRSLPATVLAVAVCALVGVLTYLGVLHAHAVRDVVLGAGAALLALIVAFAAGVLLVTAARSGAWVEVVTSGGVLVAAVVVLVFEASRRRGPDAPLRLLRVMAIQRGIDRLHRAPS